MAGLDQIKSTMTTVSNAGAELARRDLDLEDPVAITIEPDELIPGRCTSRAHQRGRPHR
jgi:hypothetical protein